MITNQAITKKRKNSVLRFFFSILYFLPLLYFSTACTENDIEEVESLVFEDEIVPLIVMEEAVITFSDSAIIKAIIESTLVENYFYFNNENVLDSQILKMKNGLTAKFYDQAGVLNSTLTAQKATRNENNKLTVIEENVVVVNADGDSLVTEYLLWDENKNTISSDKNVRVRTKDEIIFAEGFDSDVNFNNYTFRKFKGSIML